MSPDRVVMRLDELINTMDDPQAAYVVRSRLDRAMLLLRRHIEEIREVDPAAASLLHRTSRRVEDSFAALRRRSEPFGDAWVAKLVATRTEIAHLREELLSN